MNLAIIGPSGAGKGTHAPSICQRFGLRHVGTGDLLRHYLEKGQALGLLARKYIDEGELVPDEVVDAMVEEWVRKCAPSQGALFDGFPRTSYQARFLDNLLSSLSRPLEAVIYLNVSDDDIVPRLSGRLICRQCQAVYHQQFKKPSRPGQCDVCSGDLYQRPDDSPDIVRNRLRVFHRTTGPLLDHYGAANKLILVRGDGSISEVNERLIRTIQSMAHAPPFATLEDLAAITAALSSSQTTFTRAPRSTLDIVLLGGPGSGKGTQAELISKQLELPHIATGDLFRENLREASDLGQLAKTYMDRGELVPDDVTEAMVEERLARKDARDGFILDGFPRTLPQAGALTEMTGRLGRKLAGVLYIKVPDGSIVARLSGRLICRECQTPFHELFNPPAQPGRCDRCGSQLYQRSDDNPKTVRARLITFHAQTEPLIEYYRRSGLLQEIDGEGGVDQVNQRCLAAVRSFSRSRNAKSSA